MPIQKFLNPSDVFHKYINPATKINIKPIVQVMGLARIAVLSPYCATVSAKVASRKSNIAPFKSLINLVILIIIVAALNARTKIPTSAARAPINPMC